MKSVNQIIDESLQRMKENHFPMLEIEDLVPEVMIDPTLEAEEDYIGWKSIPSEITDLEISQLEKALNCKLPLSYKTFLRHKYFIQLHLSDVAISLHNILPTTKLRNLKEKNLESHHSKEIIGKGYFYFADFHDYGILAFNTNQLKENNEFEVVFMMHDEIEEKHVYAKSFEELMNYDDNQSNKFIEMLNEINRRP